MKPAPSSLHAHLHAMKQRGVVLFFALIALVVMSLAAVALIRSVDTSTLIAGNLAFKQAAASSGDAGLESAIQALAAVNTTMNNAGMNVYQDLGCPTACSDAFNATGGVSVSGATPACCLNKGYYSNADPAVSLTDGTGIQWTNSDSTLVTSGDSSGNQVRYVIQRMCGTANQSLSTTNCLFGGASTNTGSMGVQLASNICVGSGCPAAGQAVMYRITARITGPRNTVSYVQSFVY
jgi:Tfp pilus assembly protein PilX